MRTVLPAVLAIFLQAAPLQAQVATPRVELPTAVIAQRALPATVTIVALDQRGDTLSQGSGFFVRSEGVLITNWHVIQGASRAIVILASGARRYNVQYLAADSVADLAVLIAPGLSVPILPLVDSIPLVGSRVVAVGSPLGFSQTVSEGIVSATRNLYDLTYVQVTAAISPGSSGGPLLDAWGRVFAVNTATIESGQSINFAVPARYTRRLLRSGQLPQSLAETAGRSPSRASMEAGHAAAEQSPFISIYEGTVTNSGLPDWPATLHIGFEGWSPSPHGYLLIGSPLGGSGPVTAGWYGDSLGMMTTAESGDTIFWTGAVRGDQIRGVYRIVGGKWTGQGGIWSVQRRSGAPLPPRRGRP